MIFFFNIAGGRRDRLRHRCASASIASCSFGCCLEPPVNGHGRSLSSDTADRQVNPIIYVVNYYVTLTMRWADRCVDALENLRSTPEAVAGYSAALAALIAGVSSSTLGIPHNRGKVIRSSNLIFLLLLLLFSLTLVFCCFICRLYSTRRRNCCGVPARTTGWPCSGHRLVGCSSVRL